MCVCLPRIGKGGFGVVYRAQLCESTDIAVKCIQDFSMTDEEEIELFRHEAAIMW